MTTPTETTPCGCGHEPHAPNTECETPVHHGPSHMHLCLCLNRPGAALACPPQMTCQGGTLGYTDIWYLQRGQGLLGLDGSIHPDALIVEPRGPRASAEGALQQRIAAVLREAAHWCPDDDCALDERACNAVNPVQVGAWTHGVVTEIYGPIDALAAVLAPLVAKERADGHASCYACEPCGFHWHGRTPSEVVPMRDGQPVCPRCELNRLTNTDLEATDGR